MHDEIEPKEQDQAVIKAPKLSCTEAEASKIIADIGMAVLSKKESGEVQHERREVSFSDLLKLGAFVEGSGVVPLDHGAILVTRQVMLRQMLRLEVKAAELTVLKDINEITYAMGFLGAKIGQISTIGIKTKVAAEVAAEELRKKKQPSWEAGAQVGTAIQAQPGSKVTVIQPPANGVADRSPPV